MLSLSLAKKTWLHPVPAYLKILALLVSSTLLFPVDNMVWLIGALVGIMVLNASLGKQAVLQTLHFLKPLAVMVCLLLIFHLVFGDLEEGLRIGIKLLGLVMLANLLTMTTALGDMLAIVEKMIRPLARFGVNPKVVSIAVALVIRFVPVLMQRAESLIDAWRLRSKRKPRWHVIMPIGLSLIDDSEKVADALRIRGAINNFDRRK